MLTSLIELFSLKRPFRSCKPDGEGLNRLLIGRASSIWANHENDSPFGRARGSARTETLMLRRRHLKALQHCDPVRVQQILWRDSNEWNAAPASIVE
jgi:hypothetical protein